MPSCEWFHQWHCTHFLLFDLVLCFHRISQFPLVHILHLWPFIFACIASDFNVFFHSLSFILPSLCPPSSPFPFFNLSPHFWCIDLKVWSNISSMMWPHVLLRSSHPLCLFCSFCICFAAVCFQALPLAPSVESGPGTDPVKAQPHNMSPVFPSILYSISESTAT